MNLLPRIERHTLSVNVFATALVALMGILLAGCQTPSGGGGPMPTPTFVQLLVPQSSGWLPFSGPGPGPFNVLPSEGRGVRLDFFAPIGSTFGVSLRAPDGTFTALTENRGTPAPPAAGYFEIVEVNATLNPPVYRIHVRAPATLRTSGFDILVVNRSLRTDRIDSAPMVVVLRLRSATITVRVEGDGHVTSSPSAIQCGTSYNGRTLTDCSAGFSLGLSTSGLVRLAPGSNDPNTTRFLGWTGNCDPSLQVCEITIDGTVQQIEAVARFGAQGGALPTPCPAAPLRPGRHWVEKPNCGGVLFTTLQCDAQGYFCCGARTGMPSARCGGQNETLATCSTSPLAGGPVNQQLIQPGGCYELDGP